MIRVESVSKRFGRVAAVDSVSFTCGRGESIALWGGNGAGKTTLIRCMLGVLRFRGLVTVEGINVASRGKRARRMIGFVPQEVAFQDDMRLGSAMAFFARLRGVQRSRAAELLEETGLAGHEHKRVRDLSGGMKQRLALCVAMLSDPPIIILDEPTSNLDADGRAEVVEALEVLRGQGRTIVFSSHRPAEIVSLADRVLVMDRGRLRSDTTPTELWGECDGVRMMRLIVASEAASGAAAALREAGHDVHLNGQGLCVSIANDQKALPIRVLERASVEIRDFEFLGNGAAGDGGER